MSRGPVRLVISRIEKTGDYYENAYYGSTSLLEIGGKMTRLVMSYEGSDLPTHELADDFVFIGRDPSNHIVVDHPTVSGQHALLLRVGGSCSLKDLDSTNGTQVNSVVVTDAELADGDKIRFDGVTAVFAGHGCKWRSKRAIRKFWTSISI